MNKILLALLVLCSFSLADNNCSSEYNCTKLPNEDFPLTQSDYHCTLPKIKTLTINAKNVLDGEGNPKKYWDGKTVCDVLDWMNEGARKFAKVGGMAEPMSLQDKLLSFN